MASVLLALHAHAQSSPGGADSADLQPQVAEAPRPEPLNLQFPAANQDTFYRLRTRSNYLNLDRAEKTSGRRYEDLLSLELFLAQHQAWSLHAGPTVEVIKSISKSELKSGQNLDLTLGSQVGGTYRLSDNVSLSADVLQMQYRVVESAPWPVQLTQLHNEQRFLATINYKF